MRKEPEDFYILYRDKFYERFERAYLRPFAKVEAWYGFMTFVYDTMDYLNGGDGAFVDECEPTLRVILTDRSDAWTAVIFEEVEEKVVDLDWDDDVDFGDCMLRRIYDMANHIATFREFCELSKLIDNVNDENALTSVDFTNAGTAYFNRIFNRARREREERLRIRNFTEDDEE